MVPAVGFDLDGSLLDHDAAAVRGIGRLISAEGLGGSARQGEEWLRLEGLHFSAFMAGQIGFEEQRRRRMRGLLDHLGHASADHDAERLFVAYLDHYEDAWAAYPEAPAVLEQLTAMGLRLGVLTNGYQEQQERKLLRMGIRHLFDCVLSLDRIPAAKPSPLAFRALADALDVPVGACVYVGDYLPNDVIGAGAAGMRPVWVDRLGEGGGPEGVPVLPTLDGLPALIAGMS